MRSRIFRPVHRPLAPDGSGALAGAASAPCAVESRPYVLGATIIASAMAFIDGTVVHIILPAIQRDLDAEFSALQWVVNAYALMLGGLILVGGGLGDRYGRRQVFSIGITLFAIASAACALAPTVGALNVARAVQGLGAALLAPQSLAILAASFPKTDRSAAISLWAGASAVTTALGPPLGGILVDALDWRWAFWVNLPLAAAALWMTRRHVPESRAGRVTGRLDTRGGLLAILGFGALTFGLIEIAKSGGPFVWMLIGGGVVFIALFVMSERRAPSPLMPLALFNSRAFVGANLTTMFLYGALGGVLFLMPFDLIERRGLSFTDVGLTLLPIGLIIGFLSRAAGAMAERVGPRTPLVFGSVIVTIAVATLALSLPGYWVGVVAPIVALALGMAVVVAPLTTAVMGAAPEHLSGAASGVNNAASRLAGLFAVAICGATGSLAFMAALSPEIAATAPTFGALRDAPADARDALAAAFVAGYTAAMWIAAGLAALAALSAMLVAPGRS